MSVISWLIRVLINVRSVWIRVSREFIMDWLFLVVLGMVENRGLKKYLGECLGLWNYIFVVYDIVFIFEFFE